GGGQQTYADRIEGELGKAALESGDESGPVAPLNDPAYFLRHRPGADLRVGERQPMQRRRENIDPVDGVLALRPEQAFAKLISSGTGNDSVTVHVDSPVNKQQSVLGSMAVPGNTDCLCEVLILHGILEHRAAFQLPDDCALHLLPWRLARRNRV